MLKTVIQLPDGRELSSGATQVNAVQEMTLTQCVNAGQELTVGSCCANMAEIKLLTPGGGLDISAGDTLTVFREAEDGRRHKVGLFIAEKPTRPTAHSMQITAYDYVVKLDRDLTIWLAGLSDWPYRLYDLAEMTCSQCGLALVNGEIPNGDYLVQKFSGEGITGRQIMQWVGQLSGRFCRATADGDIEFAWYTPLETHNIGFSPSGSCVSWADGDLTIVSGDITTEYADGNLALHAQKLTVTDDGNGNVTLTVSQEVQTVMYYQNGLSFEDYAVAAIEKVQLRQNEEDVGAVYPDGLDGAVNTYIITANPLLTAIDAETLQPVAQTLYEILKTVSYTPCKVTMPANMDIRAGHILQITDRNRKTITAYVMQKTQRGQQDTLECTGSPTRDSTTAVNNRRLADLQGKVMNLRTDLDGLYVEHSNTTKQVGDAELRMQSLIDLTAEGILSQVSTAQKKADDLEGTVSDLTQTVSAKMTSQQVELAIQKELGKGVSKVVTTTATLTEDGLKVAKSNSEMNTEITEDGMAVYKNGVETLRANNQGVVATDLKARTYLVVGKNSRFEDMPAGDRTGCFWIGA